MRNPFTTAAVLGIALGLACAVPAPTATASAAPAARVVSALPVKQARAPHTVHVRGQQIATDDTGLNWRLTGDLVGTWSVTRMVTFPAPETFYLESGTETFVGCLNRRRNATCDPGEPKGTMRFAYLAWASFDADGRLIKGQCVHPVSGGEGFFLGARGLITMYDRPVGDEVRTRYQGTVELRASPGDPVVAAAKAPAPQSSATLTPAAQRVGC